MPPIIKEKTKSWKKKLTTKKPNPRSPSIIKLKIQAPKVQASLEQQTSSESYNAEAELPKGFKIKNIKQEHSIQLANAVATMQLTNTKKNLTNDVMVAIGQDVSTGKTKKKKKKKETKENSLENKKSRKIKLKTTTTTSKTKISRKRKVSTCTEEVNVSPCLSEQPEQPSPAKKKQGRMKKVRDLGKEELKPQLFNPELYDQLINFGNSSPTCHLDSSIEKKDTDNDTKNIDIPIGETIQEDGKMSRCSYTDNFSWVGEISSSNPTVVERSNDLVVIDGKVPIVLLVDCRDIIDDDSRNASPKSSMESVRSEPSVSVPNSPNLSTSSSELPTRIEKGLEMLRQKLNSLDLEFINWLGNDADNVELPKISYNVLKQEAEGISMCQKFKQRRLSNVTSSSESEKAKTPEKSEKVDDEIGRNEEPKTAEVDNDDDDALSLFAESIDTGLDSIATYRPKFQLFKHNDAEERQNTVQTDVPKTVCEKQNADSTVNRESEPPKVSEPGLLSKTYTPILPTKSIIFRGVCVFNMISVCKNHQCSHPHVAQAPEIVFNRISGLCDDFLIKEFMLLRKYPQLMENYILLFAREFSNRKLTRVLVEMVMVSNKICPRVRTDLLEIILENLNENGLESSQDLLAHYCDVSHPICDVLMLAIADTLNFGRFKTVFVELVEVIDRLGRSFDLDVAGKILVRVSIFPYEESLAKALILVIKNTDREILDNVFLTSFEKWLATSNGELLDQYLKWKKSAQAQLERENFEKKRYTLPDTTSLERKKTDGPLITRTIDTSTNVITYNQKPNFQPPLFKSFQRNGQFRPRQQGHCHIRPTRGHIRPLLSYIPFPDIRMNFRHRMPRPYRGRGGASYQPWPENDY